MDSKDILKAIDPKGARIKELEEEITKLNDEIRTLKMAKESTNGTDTREKSKRSSNKST